MAASAPPGPGRSETCPGGAACLGVPGRDQRRPGSTRQRQPQVTAAVLVGLLLLCLGCVPAPPSETPSSAVPVPDDLVLPELLEPAVDSVRRRAEAVTVRVRSLGCEALGVGSGFVLPGGVVVTNRHVLEQPRQVTVSTWDGRQLEAEVTGVALDSDLALLRIADAGDLPVATIRTEPVAPGEPVMVVGYPGGGPAVVTSGTVVGTVAGELLGEPADVIRVDAPIQQGNSGGPVLDAEGQVVGVAFAVEVARGTGLALPVATLLERLDAGVLVPPSTC